jgi:hypothetical protein
MTTITDEDMQKMLSLARVYCLVILKTGPKSDQPGAEKIIWEHGRRNFALRAEGLLSIVCPVIDKGSVRGIGIFNASEDQVRGIMDDDPGVIAEIFVYEIHPCRSFPGDCLPG